MAGGSVFRVLAAIAAGLYVRRSGNNLSGPFVAIRAQGHIQRGTAYDNLASPVDIITQEYAVLPLFGLQYRILRNGFISYKAGFGPSLSHDSGLNGLETSWFHDMLWLSELKVGLAF